MNKPHKHAAIIKAWADGAEIEALRDGEWMLCLGPEWHEETEYRIKPEKEYPKSSLTDDELELIYEHAYDKLREIADEAIKRYIKENEE